MHASISADASNLARRELSEPDLVTATGCDAERRAGGGRDRELGDGTTGGDALNLVLTPLSEPEVAVGAERDATRRVAQ
jgi:hypothetical protein